MPKTWAKEMNAFRKIKEKCIQVWEDPRMVCQFCPFHVMKPDRTECYFEHIGGLPPREWNENDLGRMV